MAAKHHNRARNNDQTFQHTRKQSNNSIFKNRSIQSQNRSIRVNVVSIHNMLVAMLVMTMIPSVILFHPAWLESKISIKEKPLIKGRVLSKSTDISDLNENGFKGVLIPKDDIPLQIKNSFANLNDPLARTDTPIFWHIPKSGGSTMRGLFGSCLNLVQASKFGILDGHDKDEHLEIVERDKDKKEGSIKYVNVDTTTFDGISRAKKMGLVPSGLADVISTPRLWEASEMFDADHKGRVFALFRHPIDRAVSLYYYLQIATWERTYDPNIAKMSIEDYATKGKAVNNWMTRFLVKKMSGELTESDLEVAKSIVENKILVGLLTEIGPSIRRFEKYFGWESQDKARSCQRKLSVYGVNGHSHPKLKEGSVGWELLKKHNDYDIRLYEFVVNLFKEQGRMTSLRSKKLLW